MVGHWHQGHDQLLPDAAGAVGVRMTPTESAVRLPGLDREKIGESELPVTGRGQPGRLLRRRLRQVRRPGRGRSGRLGLRNLLNNF